MNKFKTIFSTVRIIFSFTILHDSSVKFFVFDLLFKKLCFKFLFFFGGVRVGGGMLISI